MRIPGVPTIEIAFIRCNHGGKYNCVSGACSRVDANPIPRPILLVLVRTVQAAHEQNRLSSAENIISSTVENTPLASTSGTTIIDNANMPIEHERQCNYDSNLRSALLKHVLAWNEKAKVPCIYSHPVVHHGISSRSVSHELQNVRGSSMKLA